MVEIEDKIVSDEIFEECFLCDLSACKGICCVEGDSGAPLEAEEIEIIDLHYNTFKKYMTPEGLAAVEEQGLFVIDADGDYTTTLIGNLGECAYSFSEAGTTYCAMERAARNGEIDFLKPISCHLYPIRVTKAKGGFTSLNYHRWSVCSDAIVCGKLSGVKVYQALKEPLIRAFGAEFYGHLCEVEKYFNKDEGSSQAG